MSGELHGNPHFAKCVLFLFLEFSAIDMPRFFPIPTGFIGNDPGAPGQIVKIFQCIRKIYQDLTGINCTYSDFIHYGGALGGSGFFR
jgi:hypothetical protein